MRIRRTLVALSLIGLYALSLLGLQKYYPAYYKTFSIVLTAAFVALYLAYELFFEPRRMQKEIYRKVSSELDAFRRGERPYPAANPNHAVSFDAEAIRFQFPDKTESLRWLDLEAVMIRTTDQGPALCDCYWILGTPEKAVVFPMHSVGDPEFLKRMGELPGFDHEQVIAAMGCTDNSEFMCWRKP